MGGNVFKAKDGTPGTQRINRADVLPTVQWLEKLTGLKLQDHMLGTTGKKDTSGDLDLAINEKETDKEQLAALLSQWAVKNKQDPRDYVRKTGDSVHFKTPINGKATNGFVQTDFMFGDPEWMRWAMRGSGEGSAYKGADIHVLTASIAKSQGLRWSYKTGLTTRDTGRVISRDPDEIARILLGPQATAKDMNSVERMHDLLKGRPDYEAAVADARDTFAKGGKSLPESSEASHIRKLLRIYEGE